MDIASLIDKRILRLIDRLDRLAARGQASAWLVGGSLRDLYLGLPLYDYDICTTLYPDEVMAGLADLRCIPTGIEHGTVTVWTEGLQVEITTLRAEGPYSDKRHPDHLLFLTDLAEDLLRRDFTINAMAWHPDEGLSDPYNGREDLAAGLIRAVGEPTRRFREDALRILRALRFASTLGFRIEEETALAMRAEASGLRQVARERILTELRRCMGHMAFASVWSAWPELVEIVFSDVCVPELRMGASLVEHVEAMFVGYDETAPEAVCFMYLLRALQKSTETKLREVCAGLRLDGATQKAITAVYLGSRSDFFHQTYTSERVQAAYGLRRWPDYWDELLAFLSLIEPEDRFVYSPLDRGRIEALLRETRAIRVAGLATSVTELKIDGSDLLARGLRPGKQIGIILETLLDRVIEGEVRNSRDALSELAEKLISDK